MPIKLPFSISIAAATVCTVDAKTNHKPKYMKIDLLRDLLAALKKKLTKKFFGFIKIYI